MRWFWFCCCCWCSGWCITCQPLSSLLVVWLFPWSVWLCVCVARVAMTVVVMSIAGACANGCGFERSRRWGGLHSPLARFYSRTWGRRRGLRCSTGPAQALGMPRQIDHAAGSRSHCCTGPSSRMMLWRPHGCCSMRVSRPCHGHRGSSTHTVLQLAAR